MLNIIFLCSSVITAAIHYAENDSRVSINTSVKWSHVLVNAPMMQLTGSVLILTTLQDEISSKRAHSKHLNNCCPNLEITGRSELSYLELFWYFLEEVESHQAQIAGFAS